MKIDPVEAITATVAIGMIGFLVFMFVALTYQTVFIAPACLRAGYPDSVVEFGPRGFDGFCKRLHNGTSEVVSWRQVNTQP